MSENILRLHVALTPPTLKYTALDLLTSAGHGANAAT
jgi:hypothetical protein